MVEVIETKPKLIKMLQKFYLYLLIMISLLFLLK